MLTITELIAKFHAFETESGFHADTLESFTYWPLVRTQVFGELSQLQGVLGRLHHRPKDQYWQRVLTQKSPELLRRYSPTRLDQRDVLLMNHSRHYRLGDKSVSPYTHWLFADLPVTHWDLQFSDVGLHAVNDGQKHVAYLDALYNLGFKGSALRYKRSPVRTQLRAKAHQLAAALSAAFNVEFRKARADEMLWNAYRNYVGWGGVCDWLLDRIAPKLVVNVVHYNSANLVMTERAKRRGIPVAELQHGTVSSEHIGYNYPVNADVRFKPDYFLTFGDFWAQQVQGLHLPPERLPAIGFSWLEKQSVVHSAQRDGQRELLVLSQSSIAEQLSRLVADAAPKLQQAGWRVVYRLHPTEVNGWQQRLPWLANSGSLAVSAGETPLYEAYGRATAQLGVYSTAVFEGVAFSLPTFLARLPGSEGLAALVDSGAARYVADANELVQQLTSEASIVAGPELTDRIWRRGAVDNFRQFVRSMLPASAT